jgi:hypothetical protein
MKPVAPVSAIRGLTPTGFTVGPGRSMDAYRYRISISHSAARGLGVDGDAGGDCPMKIPVGLPFLTA